MCFTPNSLAAPLAVPELDSAKNKTVVDSSRIVEFIDHQYPQENPLFDLNPIKCTKQKYWIDFIGKNIIPYFYRYLKNDLSTQLGQDSKHYMMNGLQQLIISMNRSGPFFSGDTIDAVDISLIPFAFRINLLLKHYRNFELPVEGELWKRYHLWYSTNLARREFIETVSKQKNVELRLIEFYRPYSLGGGQQDVTEI